MSYDGSGTYSLPSPEYPAVPGALIKASDFNAIMLDLAAALSLCLVRDGQALATGNLNMNSKKIVGLAAGAVAGDAVRYEQVMTAAAVALGGLTPAADKFPYFTGANTADMLTIVAAVRAVLAAATVADMRTAMGVAYGVIAGTVSEGNHAHSGVYQPADADLTAIAGLTSAADSFPYFTGSGTAGLLVIVSAIRTLLASADVATFRTNLGLGDAALGTIGSTVQGYDVDTLIADVSKVRTKAHPGTKSAVTDNSLTPDLSTTETFDWTPTGAATLNAPTIIGAGVWIVRYNYTSGPTLPKVPLKATAWAATGDMLLVIGFGSADYELVWLNKA